MPSSSSAEYYRLLGQNQELASVDLGPEVEARLEALTDIAEFLEVDDLRASTYISAISARSAKELSLARLALRLEQAEQDLREHLAETEYEDELIRKWTTLIGEEPDAEKDAGALERRVQGLAAKAREYQRELDAVMATITEAPSPSVSDVVAQQGRVKETERVLRAKRARVEAYQGLPPNIELARHELQKARDAQTKLIQLRERLLAAMVEGVQ